MKRQEIEMGANEIIAEVLRIEASDIRHDARLVEDLDVDSLDCVEIIIGIENEFDIRLNDDEALKCTTVDDVYDLITAEL